MFNTVRQTQYIQFFKQIKYLDKERDDDDQNIIKYETCKENNSYKLYVFTMQHKMKNFKNNYILLISLEKVEEYNANDLNISYKI